MVVVAGSGDSSLEREFSGALGGPTVSTPNSKDNSPRRSLSGEWEINYAPSIQLFISFNVDNFAFHVMKT